MVEKHRQFSIKASYAECSKCPLIDEPSCIIETNCEKDLTKVDLIIIAENPGKTEVAQGQPLIGRAGKTFRKYFQRYKLDKINYAITNTVLCQTLDPKTGNTINPTPEVVDICKINCFKLIDICKPKLIVILGATGAKAFNLITKDTQGITSMRGRVYEWKYNNITHQIFLTLHPSYVNRNRSYEIVFNQDFENISKILKGGEIKKYEEGYDEFEKLAEGQPVHYKIPDEYYTDKYRLVDVQQLNSENKIMYIFRDSENNKHYYYTNMDYYFYYPKPAVPVRKIVPYTDLIAYQVNYKKKDQINPDKAYEADLRLATKHTIDYYLNNKSECKVIENNILFMDIEVDTGEKQTFPKAEEALFPISMIATKYNGHKTIYVVDNKTAEIKPMDGVEQKIFTDEKKMLMKFISDVKEIDPDMISGWNCISYDLQYIFNRLPRIGYSQSVFSKFGVFYVDAANYRVTLPGILCIDQDYLYRMFTFTQRENYKLGNIAQYELGETKVELPYKINEMYWRDINLTMEYNMKDTDLLDKLENKLGHINLLNEIREICNTTGSGAMSTFGQVDTILVSYLKKKGYASKNADMNVEAGRFIGAFVRQPIPGIYNWVTDFDFTSLYPSLIMTYNIGPNSFVMRFKDKTLGYNFIYKRGKMPKTFGMIIDPTFECRQVQMTIEELENIVEKEKLIYTINGCFYTAHEKEASVFKEIVSFLLDSRKVYKKKMLEAKESKDAEKTNFYNTKQLVYKTIANSLYGVIGNKVFRFFNLAIAESITSSGQEILKQSIVYANGKMDSLCHDKQMVAPKPITKTEMYDSEMPNRETPFIVTGDTDSIFCCFEDFKDISVETIEKHCDEIQTYLNNEIIPHVVSLHNADINYNRLNLKNELIIDRGLFIAKKRYVIHVIRQEGKVIDDIVGMGIETKRSDFPPKTKEFLNELIDKILKENLSIKQLLTYVETKRGEFIDLIRRGDKSVARPVGYGKKLSEYKKVPQNVVAMLNWNDLVYEAHYVGARGYLFKVVGVDDLLAPKDVAEKYHKLFRSKNRPLKVIAIPDEEPRLPEYIIPDVKLMLEFAFEDRYKLLMEPFLKNRPNATRNNLLLV